MAAQVMSNYLQRVASLIKKTAVPTNGIIGMEGDSIPADEKFR